MTTESVKQELEFKKERIIEIPFGFLFVIIFTVLNVISALFFIIHLWISDTTVLYKIVFAFELVRIALVTVVIVLFIFGLPKLAPFFDKKSGLILKIIRISFLIYLVVYFVLSIIYLLYAPNYLSSEVVADFLGKDLVSMFVLTIPFFLLSLILHIKHRNHRSRALLSFQSFFAIFSILASYYCKYFFTYADSMRWIDGDWQLSFSSYDLVSLSLLLVYCLFVILSSIFFMLFFNRLSKGTIPSSKLLLNKNNNNNSLYVYDLKEEV